MFFDEYESFLGFQVIKNKARDIRLLKYLVSHTAKKELFPKGFPSGFLHHFRREDDTNIHTY